MNAFSARGASRGRCRFAGLKWHAANRSSVDKDLTISCAGMSSNARRGWDSDFPSFANTRATDVVAALKAFVTDASESQIRAWKDAVPPLQREVTETIASAGAQVAAGHSAILEYELPLDSRRPDVIFLVDGAVVVLELKGKDTPTQADLDQVAAYARDLRCYHRDCENVPVYPVLVPMRARGRLPRRQGVFVCGPDGLDDLLAQLDRHPSRKPIKRAEFLEDDAYRPLPTLVRAARELFEKGTLRRVKAAAANTDPACAEIARIIREAAATKTRRLVLLSGVPGSGKTLVGLQTVHAHWLDDLAIDRGAGKPTSPAVFLSGNGPLVEVLQYELRAVGDGRTFVRGVKDYVKRYSQRHSLIPPEHVLVFDEAQRAWDADYVRHKHAEDAGAHASIAKSEPEHFVEFAERIPEWCVVVGLIGGGQEIHLGEEGGLAQWKQAISGCAQRDRWQVHGPPQMQGQFVDCGRPFSASSALNLERELRFHLTKDVHRWVAGVLEPEPAEENASVAQSLALGEFHLRITRDLDAARSYLRDRFEDSPDARYGLVASSRDRDLPSFRVYNEFQATKQVRFGPWYGDAEHSRRSCRRMTDCVTEFGAQGLELDGALVAWGTDLTLKNGNWSIARARGFRRGGPQPKDPMQLRKNAYRVLLTRGRAANVVFVPEIAELDETYRFLVASGCVPLDHPPE